MDIKCCAQKLMYESCQVLSTQQHTITLISIYMQLNVTKTRRVVCKLLHS